MESHGNEPNFIWPGEVGFNGFPRTIPDDYIEYSLHTVNATKTSAQQTRAELGEIQKYCNQLLKIHMKGYIWQKESFNLTLVHNEDQLKLRGRTVFGESIADEWMIVFLLFEASKKFPRAWIRCTDADGEFFLVEAANVLPTWLNPEVADNRVWVNQGRLLIIPRFYSKSPNHLEHTISLSDALNVISSHPETLLQSSAIEQAAFRRIQGYPEKLNEHFHSTLITIPRKIAYILNQLPSSISPATEAFYLRDPVVLRPLRTDRSDGLSFPPLDLVTVSAKFTRVSFSQLKGQEFSPPAAWEAPFREYSDVKHRTRLDMGMKVTCGFEMLLADPQKRSEKIVRIIRVLLDDIEIEQDLLPLNEELSQWSKTEDDERWLEVNYNDFERELAGNQHATNQAGGGFGDKTAQDNLRNIVKRFEDFLQDDSAGIEGAQVEDEMDRDNDSDESQGSNVSDDEDENYDRIFQRAQETTPAGEVSREELANAFKHLMDLPAPTTTQTGGSALGGDESFNRTEHSSQNLDEQEELEVENMMREMEQELQQIGALSSTATESSIDSDPHYQLAKNLLAGFKDQAGAPGPISNLMGAMGLHLPRDETIEEVQRETDD